MSHSRDPVPGEPAVPSSPKSAVSTLSGHCPLCGDARLRWLFEKKQRQFWTCTECGLVMQHPLPTPAVLRAYYDAEFDHGMYDTFTAAEQMKTMTARRRLKEIARSIPIEGRWLDVGCANGVFVREAIALGVKGEGIELSDVAVDQALKNRLPVRCGTLEDVGVSESFDCLTAFDVLEHVLDPAGFVRTLFDRVRPAGHVALTLPNKASIFARLMGPRWWFYIPEEHLHYFDPVVLRRLFAKSGFQVIRIERTFKPLTYNYGMAQFVEYNPLIYRMMKAASRLIPNRLREWIVPLYIGEMKIIARRPEVPFTD